MIVIKNIIILHLFLLHYVLPFIVAQKPFNILCCFIKLQLRAQFLNKFHFYFSDPYENIVDITHNITFNFIDFYHSPFIDYILTSYYYIDFYLFGIHESDNDVHAIYCVSREFLYKTGINNSGGGKKYISKYISMISDVTSSCTLELIGK